MLEATMLYKAPGPHNLHGHDVDYVVVDADEVDALVADGWHRSPAEAGAPSAPSQPEAPAVVPADNAPPTRAELEAKGAELGLKFDGRTTDKKLGAMIADALKA
jgi:hypothetical protein